ncbi:MULTISPECIES: succinate dehydrogenase, cytochrome b556 subunit [Thermaerobacter]|uniref:Succinate dehydrogenase, cytochrome b556 subunit n=1 Tax=Thermaerobacter composti TaxID=554949 RepID=A0ABZ0QQZ6_9FIRM|nr:MULTISPECIES: succinate dehydrogenase, cytochrome b556 subunit [Thermaerobacter]PZN08920.1 MAG: succinate dehydrogenase, cytochrome b556 subunit [Bacillota bacterium]QBS37164.1 succinate dehydrogenase, cytochrome b556 subunit [Thermaerobacter sp. FW80]WPD19172.1 succinate dehydrogenase, cytochrome b556 subunit [Thermaerobacter composti]
MGLYRGYRGSQGQWAWMLHRLSGVGIMLFLMMHIVDTFLAGFGPQVYDHVMALYRAPVFMVLEVVLVAGVVYHAVNGLRVILIDFWPNALRWHKPLLVAEVIVFLVLFIPAAVIMLGRLFG